MLSILQTVLGAYIAPAVLTALASALGIVILDAILGILLAFKARTFKFSKVPQFMETSFIPYVGGLLILALFSSYPQIETVFFSITAAIGVKFIADILSKTAQLFSGLSIQSPFKLDNNTPSVSETQIVSPQTGTSTNTPAAVKTIPADQKDEAQPATAQAAPAPEPAVGQIQQSA